MKRFISIASLTVFIVVLAAAALPEPARAFEANLSGQVNQLVMWADNGDESDFFIGDNTNSSTRFRFTGSEDFDKVMIGFRIELEAVRNASAQMDIPSSDDGDFDFNDRWLEAFFDHEYGRLSIGKGDGAANSTSETDLSGTAVIMYSGITDTAGGFTFVDKATGLPNGTTVGDTRSNFDGVGRNDRLRYDTPRFFGTQLAASVTNGDAWELAAFFAKEFGGHQIAASAGYVDTRDRGTSEFDQFGLSASWLAPFGLNLTAAYGMRDFDGQTKADRLAAGQTDDATNYYVKLGYRFGMHAIAAEYGMTEDLDVKGDESSNYGLAYVITPWKGVELYAAGRIYELDRPNADFEDVTQVMGGTRIKF